MTQAHGVDFGLAYKETESEFEQFDGIQGLAFPSLMQTGTVPIVRALDPNERCVQF